jgi:hypothetical protein
MIVIDRRDDPLFVIRIEGSATAEDLYAYRHLCEGLNTRQCVYATVWVDEVETQPYLHTQPESQTRTSLSQKHSRRPFARMMRVWNATLSRIRIASA